MEKLLLMEDLCGFPLIVLPANKKSMEKFSQVLDASNNNMQLCIYPNEKIARYSTEVAPL